jgi:hypothetical protein
MRILQRYRRLVKRLRMVRPQVLVVFLGSTEPTENCLYEDGLFWDEVEENLRYPQSCAQHLV